MNSRLNVVAPSTNSGGTPAAGRPRYRFVLWGALAALLLLAACGVYAFQHPERMPQAVGEMLEDEFGVNPHPVHLMKPQNAPLSLLAQIGKQIFYDQSLSASGKQSCASCHSPQHAYGPPNALAVQPGGEHLTQHGYRPPPSLTYLYRQANFSIGPDAPDMDVAPVALTTTAQQAQGVARAQKNAGVAPAAPAMVPQGGLFWDGRADTLQAQAMGPLFNPVEMANTSEAEVARKLERAGYLDELKKLFGPAVSSGSVMLVDEAMSAVSRYQIEDASFHEFNSKYDNWLEGKARLSPAELRGLRLFNNQDKANCAGCHLSQPGRDGLPPLFTDTQYEALGVPRNPELAQNKDPKFFDMGLCGPYRQDLASQTQYCGMFLTPTLRNVSTRKTFFHNGVYRDLKHVMDFYNLRETSPEKIYPLDASGKPQKYNDLPAKYAANVDIADAPFDRKYGDKPAMSDQDIDDIIAFLKTLNDGYKQ
ncbi:c-type cytochrome [Paraburkholderia sp. Ac-20340]|uniref:cytochrome-c peroxidase n=1 Tax=Paraburkholderia sp. Ac-20340 TaxID=2703888 RepID=UPI001980C7AF|nr:cytochrome c peroxidase [Paraburkholderia sp. Ac-20340]MBN3855853.1 c-type cytochrome [Paraburkholderia sp. Ac-20340]